MTELLLSLEKSAVLTMQTLLEMQKWIFSCQDVNLSSQCVPKGVLPPADYKVENTACWEHVNGCRLQREEEEEEETWWHFL